MLKSCDAYDVAIDIAQVADDEPERGYDEKFFVGKDIKARPRVLLRREVDLRVGRGAAHIMCAEKKRTKSGSSLPSFPLAFFRVTAAGAGERRGRIFSSKQETNQPEASLWLGCNAARHAGPGDAPCAAACSRR